MRRLTDAENQVSGVAVRATATTSISGPMSMTMTQAMQVTDVKTADVDERLLQVSEGYAAKPPSP